MSTRYGEREENKRVATPLTRGRTRLFARRRSKFSCFFCVAVSPGLFSSRENVFIHVHKNFDITLCFSSKWWYSIVSQAALYGTSGHDISLYYCPCFWRQNYTFTKISLKTHVFLAKVSLLQSLKHFPRLFFHLNWIFWNILAKMLKYLYISSSYSLWYGQK